MLALAGLLASIDLSNKEQASLPATRFSGEGVVNKLLATLTVATAIALFASPVSAQVVGSDSPSDADLMAQRDVERGVDPALPGSGIFDIAVPPDETLLKPVSRVPRDKYGVVGSLPLTLSDLDLFKTGWRNWESRNRIDAGRRTRLTECTRSQDGGFV